VYSAELYRLDGQISFERAQVMGGILKSLTATQRAYLNDMVGTGMLTWPNVDEPSELRGLAREVKEAMMTYAGDMFSWYAGSVEADVYFCPERHGTYFGSFYMKDAPAMGSPNYSISTNLTADMGRAFLSTLNASQAQLVTSLVDIQRPFLTEIVNRRRDISTQLRHFIAGETTNSATVLDLAQRYGELDGELVYNYAASFARVNQTLSSPQKSQLMALRKQALGDFTPAGEFLCSQPIALPTIASTDFLFLR
jgi:hypothetical protein